MSLMKKMDRLLWKPPTEQDLIKSADDQSVPEVLRGDAWAYPTGDAYSGKNLTDLTLRTTMDYAAIRAIAVHAASTEIKVHAPGDGSALNTIPEGHPGRVLTRKPNSKQEWPEFVEAAMTYREIYGHVPLHLHRDNSLGGLVTSVYPVRPDLLEIMGRDYLFDGSKRISGQDIVICRHFDPTHPIWGRSPAAAAVQSLLMDLYAHEFNVSFFYNNALPGIILKSNQLLSKTQKKQLRAGFRAAFGGQRAHGVAVMSAGLEVIPVESKHSDMEFVKLLEHVGAEILASRGVPPVMLGIMTGTAKNNAQEQRHTFLTGALRPSLGSLLAKVNTHVFNPIGVHLTPDYDSFQTTAETLHNRRMEHRGYWRDGLTTKDETRRSLGLPPAPRDGDKFIYDLNMGGVGGSGPTAANTKLTTGRAIDNTGGPENGNGQLTSKAAGGRFFPYGNHDADRQV